MWRKNGAYLRSKRYGRLCWPSSFFFLQFLVIYRNQCLFYGFLSYFFLLFIFFHIRFKCSYIEYLHIFFWYILLLVFAIISNPGNLGITFQKSKKKIEKRNEKKTVLKL